MHSDIISVFTWNVSHYIVSWKRLYEPSTSRCSLRRIRPFASPAACESLSVRTGRVHAWICSSLSASFPCCLWRRCWQCWREPRRTVYAAKAVRHLTFCAGAVLGGGGQGSMGLPNAQMLTDQAKMFHTWLDDYTNVIQNFRSCLFSAVVTRWTWSTWLLYARPG